MKRHTDSVSDYLLSHPSTLASSVPIVPLPILWSVLMDGLASIWPASRTQIDGVSVGDAWPCSDLPQSPPAQPWESIVPFHKLTQWLCYSIMVPMSKLMNIHFAGSELLTGLPEYRNGGLLVDMGLLTLKERDMQRGIEAYKENAQIKGQPNMEVVPLFRADDDVIVEWRAVTVGFLDELLDEVNQQLGLRGDEKLSLAQMLEAGTWKVCSLFSPDGMGNAANHHSLGWPRDCRSLKTKHQGASDHDYLRRHCLLITFRFFPFQDFLFRTSRPSSTVFIS